MPLTSMIYSGDRVFGRDKLTSGSYCIYGYLIWIGTLWSNGKTRLFAKLLRGLVGGDLNPAPYRVTTHVIGFFSRRDRSLRLEKSRIRRIKRITAKAKRGKIVANTRRESICPYI